tara:strand:- start:281 stop:724 length:444 start_codon:yes stop_codon:yes gene_type:complete
MNKIVKWLDTEKLMESPFYELENKSLSYYYKNVKACVENNDEKTLNELQRFQYCMENKLYPDIQTQNELIYNNEAKIESCYIYNFTDNKKKQVVQYINPNTNRYHANMLFNQMIDLCVKFNLVNDKFEYVINKKMRNKFYKFCMENS